MYLGTSRKHKAIEKLIDSEALRNQMGQAGQERVKAHFSIDAYIENMGKVFERVLSRES